MARDKSKLKSGMGKAMRSFSALIEEVENLGGGDDHVRKLETDAVVRRAVAQLLLGESTNDTGDALSVTVDYSQSLEQMIAAGRYDWQNDDITAKHFPVKGEGEVDLEITLVHYNRFMSTDDVLKQLDQRGLRPAKIEELLALGAQHPHLQRTNWIAALGSVWQDSAGDRRVAYLREDAGQRLLDLTWVGFDWSGRWRFAAVRK